MAPNIRVVEPLPWHAEYIAARMRQADREEIWASHKAEPLEALLKGMRAADSCYVVMVDEEPVVMCGVAPMVGDPSVGVPWLLGTDKILRYQRSLLRLCRPQLAAMRGKYVELVNYVSCTNTVSIRWLRWMGFSFGEIIQVGKEENLFVKFFMQGDDHVLSSSRSGLNGGFGLRQRTLSDPGR